MLTIVITLLEWLSHFPKVRLCGSESVLEAEDLVRECGSALLLPMFVESAPGSPAGFGHYQS